MIMLDTHVWIWWVQGDPRLPSNALDTLDRLAPAGIGISVISCWEVAMLWARGRLILPLPLDEWLNKALAYTGVSLVPLSRRIAVESCLLPGDLHRDPADCILLHPLAREIALLSRRTKEFSGTAMYELVIPGIWLRDRSELPCVRL